MAITTAQDLRRRLGDPLRRTAQWFQGDGTATGYFLSGYPVHSGAAGSAAFRVVSGNGVLTATGGTAWDFDRGIVALPSALSAGSAALAEYTWSVFSEEEIGTLTGAYGSLDEMARAGIEWLQGEYSRRVKWAMAQGPEVAPTMAAKHLAALWAQYDQKLHTDSEGLAIAGGLEAWSESQQSYGYPDS